MKTNLLSHLCESRRRFENGSLFFSFRKNSKRLVCFVNDRITCLRIGSVSHSYSSYPPITRALLIDVCGQCLCVCREKRRFEETVGKNKRVQIIICLLVLRFSGERERESIAGPQKMFSKPTRRSPIFKRKRLWIVGHGFKFEMMGGEATFSAISSVVNAKEQLPTSAPLPPYTPTTFPDAFHTEK